MTDDYLTVKPIFTFTIHHGIGREAYAGSTQTGYKVGVYLLWLHILYPRSDEVAPGVGLEVDDTPLESLEPPDGAVRAPHALYLHCGRLQLLGLVQLSARVHTSPVRLLTTYQSASN